MEENNNNIFDKEDFEELENVWKIAGDAIELKKIGKLLSLR